MSAWLSALPQNGLLVGALVVALWVASVRKADASIIDPWWSIAFLAVALRGAVSAELTPAKVLLLAIVALWAVRLFVHLLRRGWGEPEDPRYRAFRERFGSERYWWVSLFQVFLLQGALVLVVSAPLVVALAAPGPGTLGPLAVVGAAVFAAGFAFEAVGDAQLARFRADPASRGRVLDRGLWRYTRHPNYFGEAVLWWGFWISALGAPGGAETVFGPALMTVLLLRVSGVTMLEPHLRASRPAYADYERQTSAFIPWPPRPVAPGGGTTRSSASKAG
jgi:steroid 5-alpha reductase family enzyme